MEKGRRTILRLVILSVMAVTMLPAPLGSIRSLSGVASAEEPKQASSGGCVAGEEYDPICDVNRNGIIDIVDIMLVASKWRQEGTWTSDSWSLTGNPGTTPGTNFLGTTDDQALQLHVNGLRALRLEPSTTSPNLIGGSGFNGVTAGVKGATIGGGGSYDLLCGSPQFVVSCPNWVTDDYGTVGGGEGNLAGNNNTNLLDARFATIGGGSDNTASGGLATVGGGSSNDASGEYATVGGGSGNTASDSNATIGGGSSNDASGEYATVGGGRNNEASGQYATIGGGSWNTASGDYSFAAGLGAWANHDGTFVWADSRIGPSFTSTGADQFLIRASGGVGIGTNSPNEELVVDGGNSTARIAIDSTSPTANAGIRLRQDGTSRWSVATVGTDGDFQIYEDDAGVNRLFIKGAGPSQGSIGIGTTSPYYKAKMHVVADGDFDGIVVNATDNTGVKVNKAATGVYVVSTSGVGVLVDIADGDGVYVSLARNDGMHIVQADHDGVNIFGANHDGIHVSGAGNFAGQFTGIVQVTGCCICDCMSTFARNVGRTELEPGDIVAVHGVTETDLYGTPLVMDVGLAAGPDAVIGVVADRAEIDKYEISSKDESEVVERLIPGEGPAQPGDYVNVITYGRAQVKVSALAAPIIPGTRLTAAGEAGIARAVRTVEVQGMRIAGNASVIGIALESLEDGEDLIWVLVMLQ